MEFALVLPLLFALIFAAIEFGVAMYDKSVLTNASREGARAAIVAMTPRITDAQITSVVNTYAQNNMLSFKSASLATTVSPAYATRNATGSSATPITVQVTYNYGFLMLPRFLTTFTGTLNLRGATVMRME